MIKVEIDPESDTAYIILGDGSALERQGSVEYTSEVAAGVNIDFAATGEPLGIEILTLKDR
jgi:uncharacterized protein YuzE